MTTTINEYWGNRNLEDKKKRFYALLEVYPVRDFKIQLQELKKVIDEVLEDENENKNITKEEVEAVRIIKSEIEKLLSQEKVTESDFDFIAALIFNGAKMPQYSFLGLF